ncbi:HlyU family transcriptional regulator [Palleronia sp. KMU-117]|uniref:HlyU family transcriptional regulator n=1 Tax=Palleronia sp. KMU-117 TaxID=3434108 RepID=UPI003D7209C3
MSLFSRLFGGGGSSGPTADAIDHKGFAITPTPIREGSQYRISARITKEVGGVTKTHTLIRADMLGDPDGAAEASVAKAKMLIDEQGERLFD